VVKRNLVARIGIFGGTFDPVHRGHLAVARAALRRLKLDRLYFVPAGVSPHKQHRRPRASFAHRVAMLKLATASEPRFAVSLLEARGVHYSIDTVRRFRRSLKKGDRLFFILGADAFREISTWRKWKDLLQACELAVASRPGASRNDAKGAVVHPLRVHNRVSATQVRNAARRGWPLAKFLPSSVAQYIKRKNLYRA
jgi:nicotinate-nucleotide adenylyltransferase